MTDPTKQAPVCLVAGGATGIGAETARLMAGRGCRIAICDINRNDGEQVAADLGGHFFYTDVREDESVRLAVEGCAQQLGIPTYVSLNFGVMTAASDSPFQPLEAVSIEAYRRVMSVNVDGVFFGLRHLIPLMREADGTITVTASRAALVPTAADVIYASSKAAILHMVRCTAAGQIKGNLRINALCPGTVDTSMLSNMVREAGIPLISATDMAEEVVALMTEGANGEVRGRIHGHNAISIGTFGADLKYQPAV